MRVMEFDQMIFLLDQFTKIQNSKSPGELAIIESSEKPTTEMLQFFLVYRIPIQSKEQTVFRKLQLPELTKLRFDKGHLFFVGGLIFIASCHHSLKDILRGSALEYGAPKGRVDRGEGKILDFN